jgi:enamine deaminase RidA (YjgF/YER057c/UK114 family)
MSQVIQPKGWARPRGYANGVVATGRTLFVAGQVGWDPTNPVPTFEGGFVAQFERALMNVMAVVREAGGAPEHLVRMTVYVTNKHEYIDALGEIGAVWKKQIGNFYPAMALVQVASLLDDRAKVEIEATAVMP